MLSTRYDDRNKMLLTVCLTIAVSFSIFAQKKSSLQLELAPAASFALYDGEPVSGYGGNVKFIFPLRKNENYLTSGINYDRLIEKSSFSDERYKYSIITAILGYRRMIKSFFIEPQVGAGLYIEEGNDYRAFATFIGVEPGFRKNNLTFSLSYRFLVAEELVFGEQFHILSLKVGFRLPRLK